MMTTLGVGNLFQIGPLFITIFLCIFVNNVNSFSKYGRSCSDIGCPQNQVCTLAHDSCSFGQREGKECGNYPTCSKVGAGSSSASKHDNDSPSVPHSSYNSHSNTPSSSLPSHGGSSAGGDGSGLNSHLYPQIPPLNPAPSAPIYPSQNTGGGGVPQGGYMGGSGVPQYGGYNPQTGGNGGYQPPAGPGAGYGGYGGYGGHGGQGGYAPGGGYGGYGGYGGGGQYYGSGGSGGYGGRQPDKDKEGGGFLSSILSNPVVGQAISNVIKGQIQKALQGGGNNPTNNPQYPNNQPGQYGGYGGNAGSSGSGSSALNFLGGLLSNGGNQPPKQSGSSSTLGFLGDLLSNSGNSRTGGYGRGSENAGGGIGDFFNSRQFGGLFSENPSSSSSSRSNSHKSYPTQAPPVGGYGR